MEEYDVNYRLIEKYEEIRMQVITEKTQHYIKYKEINSYGYGKGIIDFSERWAELMEPKISEGQKIQDIAEELGNKADAEGISGFMYGAAVVTLAKFWIHGEDLRVWHNLKTQINKEGEEANKNGGVINPAILSITS